MSDSSMSSFPPISGKKEESLESKGGTPIQIMRDLVSQFMVADKGRDTDKLNMYENALMGHLQKNNLYEKFLFHTKGISIYQYPKLNALRTKAEGILKANVEALHKFAQLHDAPKTDTTIKVTQTSSANSESVVKEKSDLPMETVPKVKSQKGTWDQIRVKEAIDRLRLKEDTYDSCIAWQNPEDGEYYISGYPSNVGGRELHYSNILIPKDELDKLLKLNQKLVEFHNPNDHSKIIRMPKIITTDELEIADLEKMYLIDSIKTPEQAQRFQEVVKHKEELLGQARFQSSGFDVTVFWKDKDNRFYITDKDRTIEIFPEDIVRMKKDIENRENKYVTIKENRRIVLFNKPIRKTDYDIRFKL